MRKTLAILSVIILLSAAGESESAPLFGGRLLFQRGPITIPVPAFLPFFPGGNIVIPGNQDRANPPANPGNPGAAQVDPAVHKDAVDLGTRIGNHTKLVNEKLPPLNKPEPVGAPKNGGPRGKGD